jgi:hypothetical protein
MHSTNSPPGRVDTPQTYWTPKDGPSCSTRVGTIDHLVYTAGQNVSFTRITDYTTQAANMMLGLRVICALGAMRLAIPAAVTAVIASAICYTGSHLGATP